MKYDDAIQFSRDLRKNQTPAEKELWEFLRSRRLLGLRFLRQYKIEYANVMGVKSYFFVDFYCPKLKLIMGVDGAIHNKQKDYDLQREKILKEMGFRIYRIKNEDVMSDQSLNKLKLYCFELLS